MTKQFFTILILLVSLRTFAQTKADTLKPFLLTYASSNGHNNSQTTIVFKDPGIMTVVIKTYGYKKPDYQKTITVDKNSFSRIKDHIVNDYKVFLIPDSINSPALHSSYVTLTVKVKGKTKIIRGQNPQKGNAKFEELSEFIFDVIGFNLIGANDNE